MCRYLSRYIPFVQLQGIFHLYLGGYVLEDVNYNLNNSMHRYARKCRLKSEPWYHLSMRRLHWTLRCWSGWRRAPWLGDTSRTWWGCCTVLYCTVLYCTVLYCTVLYFTVLYCTVLYCTVLYCTVLYCAVLYCTVLYCRWPASSGPRSSSCGTWASRSTSATCGTSWTSSLTHSMSPPSGSELSPILM